MTALFLIYEPGGDLAGLERGQADSEAQARAQAERLLDPAGEVSAVEIWSGGRLLGAVGR